MVEVLLQATTRVLKEEGYAGASTNRIAKAAGVSVGSLYQYFPNKEALVLEVVRRHTGEMLQLLQDHAIQLASEPIDVAVRTYVRAMLTAHRMDPDLHRVITEELLQLGFEHVEDVQRRARFVVRAYLEMHREEILPTNLDVAAYLLVAAVESVTHMALLEDQALDDPDLDEELCAMIVRYLLGHRSPAQ